MRRKDREISGREEMLRVMRSCDVCHLALNDLDGSPYIIALNFGIRLKGEKIFLIFHSALEGHKLDLIRRDERAAFMMDCGHQLQYIAERGYCTMAYESVAGKGRVHILDDAEKEEALKELMKQYHPEGDAYYNPDALARTCVYALEVEEISGKRKSPK